MSLRHFALVSGFLCVPLLAQNLVTNGDFETGTLAPWVAGGVAFNPQLEAFDIANRGSSWTYGCGPGGNGGTPPYAPNWIQQNVTLTSGVTYEFSCDLASGGAGASDFHAGTCSFDVNGVEIGRLDFLNYVYPLIERGRLAWRFTSTVGGSVPLRVNFQRPFYVFNAGTPRMHVDNVSLRAAIGPTFTMPANRQMGPAQLPFNIMGAPGGAGAPFALFASPVELQPGLSIPGVSGLLNLNPSFMVHLFDGNYDNNSYFSTSFQIPIVPALTTSPVWFQAVDLVGGKIRIGFHHGLTFVL